MGRSLGVCVHCSSEEWNDGSGMHRTPIQTIVGLALIALAWPIAWQGWEPWSLHTFFPMWLGYILLIDGVVRWRTGTSLLSRSAPRFVALFLISAPGWWLFEAANSQLQNWEYQTSNPMPRWQFVIRATIAFSTVVPALFETAELYRSFSALRRPVHLLRIDLSRSGLMILVVTGIAMMIAAVLFPDRAYPLIWIGAFLTLDPINRLLGARSVSAEVAHNNWSNVLALFASGITCGFLWEMWNSRSMPRWVYEIPHIDMPKLFEMPLLGYGGYLPFALEVFAFYQLVCWLLTRQPDTFVLPAFEETSIAARTEAARPHRWTAISGRSYNPSGREHAD